MIRLSPGRSVSETGVKRADGGSRIIDAPVKRSVLAVRLAASLASLGLAVACTSPASPSGTSAPMVTAFHSIGSRPNQPSGFADMGETVTLSASISNEGSGTLSYVWSGPGTFTGRGPTVSWTAPALPFTTPATQGLTLTVTERHDEGGVTRTETTSDTFRMRLHDSQKEILDMGEDFLTLFSRNEVPTDTVLHNFSTACDGRRGRRDEASDTNSARLKYHQDFSKFRITRNPPVTFNFGGACLAFGSRIRPADACALFTVHWEFIYLVGEDGHKAGDRGVTDGKDHVTAVLENGDWKLCHSDFQ
jgi:hypothetical protein